MLSRWRKRIGDPEADKVPPHVTLLPPTTVDPDQLELVEKHLQQAAPTLSRDPAVVRWLKQPSILRRLVSAYDYQLKFVVAQPGDLSEIQQMLDRLGADRGKVILMPEGVDASVLRERSLWLAEIAKREGFRFSPRLHVDLWGNRRGI